MIALRAHSLPGIEDRPRMRSPQVAQSLRYAKQLLGAERAHFLTEILSGAALVNELIDTASLHRKGRMVGIV